MIPDFLPSGAPAARLLNVFLSFGLLSGCSSKEEEPDLGNPVENNPCDIPVDDLNELLDWLEGENYSSWSAESSIHDSAGPHFGNVRTWISPELETSFDAGQQAHPLCSASVKELYGDDEIRGGWSLSVKVSETGTPSDWFWYEVYESEAYAGGTDVDLCTNCHGAGTDFVRTTYPLE